MLMCFSLVKELRVSHQKIEFTVIHSAAQASRLSAGGRWTKSMVPCPGRSFSMIHSHGKLRARQPLKEMLMDCLPAAVTPSWGETGTYLLTVSTQSTRLIMRHFSWMFPKHVRDRPSFTNSTRIFNSYRVIHLFFFHSSELCAEDVCCTVTEMFPAHSSSSQPTMTWDWDKEDLT